MKTTPISLDSAKSNFGERLSAIRLQGKEATQARRAHQSAADVLRSQELVASYAFLGQVERAVIALFEDLAPELPSAPKIARSFFDGRYQVELRFDEDLRDRQGNRTRRFSRMAFLISPDAHQGRFTVESRATARSRDLESEAWMVDMGPEGLTSLEAFLETRVLAFAQRLFEAGELTPAGDAAPDVSWIEDALKS